VLAAVFSIIQMRLFGRSS